MATIVVEDGSQVVGANSYVSEAELSTYATDRGVTISGTAAVLLIEAMDYVESLDFLGYKLTDTQALQWPRADVRKDKIYWYDTDEIPQRLKDGLCEVALAVDAGNSPIADVERTTIMEKVGDLQVQYKPGSSANTVVKKIGTKLNPLLSSNLNSNSFIVKKA